MDYLTDYEMSQQHIMDVLEDMNTCSSCTDIQATGSKLEYKRISIDWLLENLPGIDYVMQRLLNYMFSNGVTTGAGSEADAKLNHWLYEEENLQGATNYSVLRSILRDAILRGECGMRIFEGNIYQVPKGKYGILYLKRDGIEEVVAYFIKKNMDNVEEEINTEIWGQFASWSEILEWFDDNGYILLDDSQFVNIRNDVSTLHGYSPLTRDRQRLSLIIAIYERLNYDIRYDGPGRLFLHTKDEYVGDNEKSTGAVLNSSPQAMSDRYKEAMEEARDIATFLKNSSSDTVGVISGAFDNNILHIPRVTQAKEFLDWLEIDTVVMAQIVGMSPTLLEVGKLHGNVSVAHIIDTAMTDTVIPMRETYAIQFSPALSNLIGVPKVYFDKYDMQQIEDENDIRLKVAEIIKALSVSYRNSESEDTLKLIDEMTDVLRGSIYDDHNNLRPLRQ